VTSATSRHRGDRFPLAHSQKCGCPLSPKNVYAPENLVSSIYLKLGIDPDKILHNQSGRPTHLVSDPRPIAEIM
jgi:hypothetical protein